MNFKSLVLSKYLIYVLVVLFVFTACDNDDDIPVNPIDQLPSITMIGANTIGCLVDGVPFTDKGLMNNFYQFVDGEYILAINWEENLAEKDSKAGRIGIRNIEIEAGKTYILNISDFLENNFTGGFGSFVSISKSGQFETNENFTGKITFTTFDIDKNIMSGTFEFQAQEITTGEIINITNGRFDMKFTQ